MDATAKQFLENLLSTPSPSGYEQPVQQVVRDYAKNFADEIRTDLHGNVICVRNPRAKRRLMLSGHCDQIGLIVQYIDPEGFIFVQPIGGWDTMMLPGQRMVIRTDAGPIQAVIGRKPIHLLSDEERKSVPKMEDLWLDIGATNQEEAAKLVRVGDCVTLELELRYLPNGRFISPGLDDKVGVWVVMEALRRVDSRRLGGVSGKGTRKSAASDGGWGVYAVSSVQEELGLRGAKTSAFGIDPEVGIAVDVTFSTDFPSSDKKKIGDIRIGGGPVVARGPNMNPRVAGRLLDTASLCRIPVQTEAIGRGTGTDANAIQLNRAGVAAGLVSIPNRYMHSPVELCALDDLEQAVELLARFINSLDATSDFTP